MLLSLHFCRERCVTSKNALVSSGINSELKADSLPVF